MACIGRAIGIPSTEAAAKSGRMVAIGVVARRLGHTVLAPVAQLVASLAATRTVSAHKSAAGVSAASAVVIDTVN